jgi:hypothetical protein
MGKHIYVPDNVKRELIDMFSTNKMTLWNALNFVSDSGFARTLRAAALQRGGLIYTGQIPDGYLPDINAEHDRQKGIVIQSFGDQARITISKSQATIEVEGCNPVVIDNVTTGNWMQLLYGVQIVVNNLNK